jgi:primosomal protein N' (replication factor Y)
LRPAGSDSSYAEPEGDRESRVHEGITEEDLWHEEDFDPDDPYPDDPDSDEPFPDDPALGDPFPDDPSLSDPFGDMPLWSVPAGADGQARATDVKFSAGSSPQALRRGGAAGDGASGLHFSTLNLPGDRDLPDDRAVPDLPDGQDGPDFPVSPDSREAVGMPCALVAVESAAPGIYSYLIPPGMDVMTGQTVLVPFAGRDLAGYVMGVEPRGGGFKGALKPILAVVRQEPLFGADLTELARFVSDYYHYPLGLCVREILPGGLAPRLVKEAVLTEAGLAAAPDPAIESSSPLKVLLAENPRPVALSSFREKGAAGILGALARKGLVRFLYRLSKKGAGFATEIVLSPDPDPPEELPRLGRAERELWERVKGSPPTPVSHYRHYIKDPVRVAKGLQAKGLVVVNRVEISRDDPDRAPDLPRTPVESLTDEQEAALGSILAALDRALDSGTPAEAGEGEGRASGTGTVQARDSFLETGRASGAEPLSGLDPGRTSELDGTPRPGPSGTPGACPSASHDAGPAGPAGVTGAGAGPSASHDAGPAGVTGAGAGPSASHDAGPAGVTGPGPSASHDAGPAGTPGQGATASPDAGHAGTFGSDPAEAPRGQEPGRFLLFGVTGSGKTEVYLRAAARVLSRGGGVLWLAPEIALTLGLEARIKSSLPGVRLAVLHSGLSTGERHDHWMNLARGRLKLALGARSAVFAPVRDLKLVIVDEEHDWAYKQEHGLHYHGRDLASFRARRSGAVLILGSATPSLESYRAAETGRMKLLVMKERPGDAQLPKVRICDRRGSPKGGRILSPELRNELISAFGRGEQALLFVNRRGWASFPLCMTCGETLKCPNCSLNLTLHGPQGPEVEGAEEGRIRGIPEGSVLICHGCGWRGRPPAKCPSCGAGMVRYLGAGTERIHASAEKDFKVSGLRLDVDATRRKGGLKAVLEGFGRGEAAFMVGTQMAAKGHDFPNLTVVGVVDADIGLNLPDFRAAERTYQLLSQVSGRAGRAGKPGRVVIQTMNPDHYSVSAASSHDYGAFYRAELAMRRDLGLPPFGRLALLRLSGPDEVRTERAASRAGAMLRETVADRADREDFLILGPAPSPVVKLKERYRFQIMFRAVTSRVRGEVLSEFIQKFRKSLPKHVAFAVDVDPYHLM